MSEEVVENACYDVFPQFMDDPTVYGHFFGEYELYWWQQDVIRDVLNKIMVSLLTCNSSGKTSRVIALLGLIIMAKWPGSFVVSTSGSWNQITAQLWPVLRDKVSGLDGWEYSEKKIRGPIVTVDGKKLQSQWMPFSTNDAEKAEGYHDQWTFGDSGRKIWLPRAYLIDEGKGVDDAIYTGFSRCRCSFKMIASSAGENEGYFYESHHKLKEMYKQYVIDWTMCPHLYEDPVERQKIETDIRINGRKDPIIKSKYFAEFFEGAGYKVFDVIQFKHSMTGLIPKVGYERCGSFDWSAGSDEQVWGVREGNTVLQPLMCWHERDGNRLAKMLIAEFKKWNLQPCEIVVDAGGGGTPFIHLLENYGYKGVRYYNGADPPLDKRFYADKATEDTFEHLAYHFNNLNLYQLRADDVLEKEIREREYVMRNNDENRKKLQPKEEIRRHGGDSPNRLDCLEMMFSTWKPVDVRTGQSPRNIKCPDVSECYKPNEYDDKEDDYAVFDVGWRS